MFKVKPQIKRARSVPNPPNSTKSDLKLTLVSPKNKYNTNQTK